jgi:hypothetical protein
LLALLYAMEHPGRVARLALVSAAPAWRTAREEFERRFEARTLTPELQEARRRLRESGLRERDPQAHASRLFELAVAGYFHDPARATMLTPFRITERTRTEAGCLGDFDLAPVPPVSLPALVLHGDDDPIPQAARDGGASGSGVPSAGLRSRAVMEAFDEFVRLATPSASPSFPSPCDPRRSTWPGAEAETQFLPIRESLKRAAATPRRGRFILDREVIAARTGARGRWAKRCSNTALLQHAYLYWDHGAGCSA